MLTAVLCVWYERASRDTVFWANQDATLVMPDGARFRTNQWGHGTSEIDWIQLLERAGRGGDLIIQGNDHSRVAHLVLDGVAYEAEVTAVRGGKNVPTQYWLEFGDKTTEQDMHRSTASGFCKWTLQWPCSVMSDVRRSSREDEFAGETFIA